MSKRHAVTLKDPKLFLKWLGLPEDIEVLGFRGDLDGTITPGLQHASFPPVHEGGVLPRATLTFYQDESEAAPGTRLRRLSAAWDFAPDKRWPIGLAEVRGLEGSQETRE